MSCCWNNCCCCCCRRNRFDDDANDVANANFQAQAQAQRQRQAQLQAQAQLQGQEAEQETRSIFKEIGNVRIDIDNTNIAVAVLAILAFLHGSLDGAGIQSIMDKVLAKTN